MDLVKYDLYALECSFEGIGLGEVIAKFDPVMPFEGDYFDSEDGKARIVTWEGNVYCYNNSGILVRGEALLDKGEGYVTSTFMDYIDSGVMISISDQINYRGQQFFVDPKNLAAKIVEDVQKGLTHFHFKEGEIERVVSSEQGGI